MPWRCRPPNWRDHIATTPIVLAALMLRVGVNNIGRSPPRVHCMVTFADPHRVAARSRRTGTVAPVAEIGRLCINVTRHVVLQVDYSGAGDLLDPSNNPRHRWR